MKKKPTKPVEPTPQELMVKALAAIDLKFDRLTQIKAELNKVKALYAEHDAIVEELLPLFIEVKPDRFIVKREISLGSQTRKLSPTFFNVQKNKLVGKVWKSTALEMGYIE